MGGRRRKKRRRGRRRGRRRKGDRGVKAFKSNFNLHFLVRPSCFLTIFIIFKFISLTYLSRDLTVLQINLCMEYYILGFITFDYGMGCKKLYNSLFIL